MRIAVFVATVTLSLMGGIASAQSVTYDFDKTTDFSRFKSYAWASGSELNDEWNHSRIVNAVDAQLVRKGLKQVERSANPDVLVTYHAVVDRNVQITGAASGWGGYRFAGSRSGSARAQEILVGTLIVDIVDARTRTIVWRGLATRDIDVKANPQKREKNINKAAEKLFKNYPPAQ